MAPSLECRPAADWDEVRRATIATGRSFDRTPEDPFFFERVVSAPALPLDNTLLCFADGNVAAGLQVYERRIVLGGRPVPAGAIGNVFTVPERRGEGIGTRLLEYARSVLADRGYALSILRTGDELRPFYRGGGWRSAPYEATVIEDPAADGDADAFAPFSLADDLDDLAACYRETRGGEDGAFRRWRSLWTDWLFDPGTEIIDPEQVALYRPGGDLEGYLIREGSDCLELGYRGDDSEGFLRDCWATLAEADQVTWHPPWPDALADATDATPASDAVTGTMVQAHVPALLPGDVGTTADLVEYLDREGVYWSPADRF